MNEITVNCTRLRSEDVKVRILCRREPITAAKRAAKNINQSVCNCVYEHVCLLTTSGFQRSFTRRLRAWVRFLVTQGLRASFLTMICRFVALSSQT